MKITEEKVVVVTEKKELEVGDIVFTDKFMTHCSRETIPCCVVELADELGEYGVIPLANPFVCNGSPNILKLKIKDVMWEYPILHIAIKDWHDLKFQNLNQRW